ncbi:hypothetical protein BY458DRAFT_511454 [Sporodiniella umbellata]|nr:hypothetical protein BY458DRAFT_511454 [Sporodiniella umbellata]
MGIISLSPLEVNNIFKANIKGYCFIDLREQEEIKSQGKIRNFINVPFGLMQTDPELFERVFSCLKNVKFVLSCRSGRRSLIVSEFLINCLKLQSVYNLSGGILGWIKSKLNVELFQNNHSPLVIDFGLKTFLVIDSSTRDSVLVCMSRDIISYEVDIEAFSNAHNINIKSSIHIVETLNLPVNHLFLSVPCIKIEDCVGEEWVLGNSIKCKIIAKKAIIIGDSIFGEHTIDKTLITRHYF